MCRDGKSIRAAVSRPRTGTNLYIVNVVAAGFYLFMNQVLVGPKRQEGKVIEENIAALLNGQPGHCTLDAMGTKKAILDLLVDMGCDATLPVKSNNETLKKGIVEFILSKVTGDSELVEYFADLNGYSDDDTPAKVILNTKCNVFDEDNRNVDDAAPETPAPVEVLPMFDDFYSYANVNGEPVNLNPDNSQLYYVKVGERLVKMVFAHGRLERREFELVTDPTAMEAFLLGNNAFGGWNRIVSVGQVTRYRGERRRDPETKQEVWEITVTRTPYISTCCQDVREFASIIRSHWEIEAWHGQVLDKVMKEDACTTRAGNAPENLSCLRKLAADLVIVEMADRRLAEGSLSTKPAPDGKTLLDGFKRSMESMKQNIRVLRNLITRRIRSPFKKAQ